MTASLSAAEPTAEQIEFFESKIRPVLVEHCYDCHNSAETTEGGLALDHRRALLDGGDGGAIVVPGKPGESRLLAILRHEVEDLEMPDGGPKLDDRVIADFEKWIALGLPDPRDNPPSADDVAAATSWEAKLQRRKQWWSFQPIASPAVPDVQRTEWSGHPVDRFILSKLEENGLEPVQPAEPRVLVRRLYFTLVGLPPSPEEASRWSERIGQADGAERDRVIEALVGELLESPHFGERWARHWMDWIRYAESHGSEGDPAIDNAWLYRDYLIRALNADVPYDQLVREHVAGDLLDEPRVNEDLGINESAIGPAHWRMVFHGFAPTDALDERVRFTDDQINAFSKAFLGLTVSCARCHDHKFDAISQADYYAMFGILSSCRPARTVIDLPEKQQKHSDRLAELKPQIRDAIADAWLDGLPGLRERLLSPDGPSKDAKEASHLLHPLREVRQGDGNQFAAQWDQQRKAWEADVAQRDRHREAAPLRRWDLSRADDFSEWFPTGIGLPESPDAAGEFAIAPAGDAALTGIYPSGVYSHGLSAKHPARLTSPDVTLDGEYDLWVRVIGDGGASLRYVVQNYPRSGTVYPVTNLSPQWRWQKYDLTYWNGDAIHVELTAGPDAPLLVKNNPRSWFGVQEAVLLPKGAPGPHEGRAFLDPVFKAAGDTPPESVEQVVDRYIDAIGAALSAWKSGSADDAQAALLAVCLEQGLLSNQLDAFPAARDLIAEYRRLENDVPVPTRVPGVDETVGYDQPLYIRGNHKQPGDAVPRRFLEAIDPTPYETHLSGRRELAEDLLREDNPLTRRVIVNRIWHHLFGQGIVATPDNFGRLGQKPTHPELLDWLANHFAEEGWSLKRMIRLLVTSRTWQLSSMPGEKAKEIDPGNKLLSHANVRRLEAEAVRDTLLSVTGVLDRTMYGPPVDGNAPRRSIYVRVRRNSLDPFLRVFDFPEPFSATGRRSNTNVPAQSLTLMNDPRLERYAKAWGSRFSVAAGETTEAERVSLMFEEAFAREATPAEVDRVQRYLADLAEEHNTLRIRLTTLQKRVRDKQQSIEQITGPVRERLLAEAGQKVDSGQKQLPAPVAAWEFDDNFRDSVGNAHGTPQNGARLEDGALVVSGNAHVVTAPIAKPLREKTLEAWVRLDNLDQRGGGVMSVQSPDGRFFDAIVFGEKDPRQWLAGSNNFARTESFGGPQEQEAVGQPVHIAIVYHSDGRIVGYRNGQPYGRAYQSDGPYPFEAGSTVVSFGVRHLPAVGNRLLAGRILQARLYDRALSAEELLARYHDDPAYVSESQVLAELSEDQRRRLEGHEQQIARLEEETASLGPVPQTLNEQARWADLAKALFTFKEFIYVR
ncbi:DUF1553 domain-containing protein [Maioricimonas rarisocia]|nr:DUF1553 domain-containing protein [Maioricimonas rarisocia]